MTRAGHVAGNALVRLLALGIGVVAIGIPAFVYLHPVHGTGVAEQIAPPAISAASIADIPRVPPIRGAIPVLTYHGVSDTPGKYTVKPREFVEQIAGLRRAGFHSISDRQFVNFVKGRTQRLPRRPLLITFDDGIKSIWTRADPVLREYGFRATVFLITSAVSRHQPYYLTWQEVDRMRHDGRWDFGSHTRNGHHFIQVGPRFSQEEPFLTNLRWRPHEHRLESIAQYRSRVITDLDGSIADLRSHHLGRPLVFADPFSATNTAGNDRRVAPLLLRIEARRFPALVNNVNPPRYATREQLPAYIRRIEVFNGTSARGLIQRILDARSRTRVGRRA